VSGLPASLLVPNAPQVNLIPPEVASRKAAGRARGLVVIALLLFVSFLGAVSYFTDIQKKDAVAEQLAAEQIAVDLQAEIDQYFEVPLVQTQLQNAVSARLFAGATELRWKVLLDRIRAEMPAGVNLSSVSFAASDPFGVISTGEGPYSAPGVGTLAFTASSDEYLDAAELERALNRVVGLTNTVIPSVVGTVDDDGTTFTYSGSVTVTAQALDLRFTDAWFQARYREIASDFLDAYIAGADAMIAAAQASVAAGTPDSADALELALERQESVVGAQEAFVALSAALATSEANLEVATTDQANGVEGAEADVETVQAAIETLTPALDDLATAVLALKSGLEDIDTAATRVAAAEALVAAKEAQLAAAKVALAAATTEDREALQADVDYYEVLVSEAQAVLTKEEAAATAADDAAATALVGLVSATDAAETALTTANVTSDRQAPGAAPAVAPTTSPSASPSVSPSPSASQGGDSS